MSELSCADEDHPLKLAESLPVTAVKNETEGTCNNYMWKNCKMYF